MASHDAPAAPASAAPALHSALFQANPGLTSCSLKVMPLRAQDCLALGAIFAATDTVAVLQVSGLLTQNPFGRQQQMPRSP